MSLERRPIKTVARGGRNLVQNLENMDFESEIGYQIPLSQKIGASTLFAGIQSLMPHHHSTENQETKSEKSRRLATIFAATKVLYTTNNFADQSTTLRENHIEHGGPFFPADLYDFELSLKGLDKLASPKKKTQIDRQIKTILGVEALIKSKKEELSDKDIRMYREIINHLSTQFVIGTNFEQHDNSYRYYPWEKYSNPNNKPEEFQIPKETTFIRRQIQTHSPDLHHQLMQYATMEGTTQQLGELSNFYEENPKPTNQDQSFLQNTFPYSYKYMQFVQNLDLAPIDDPTELLDQIHQKIVIDKPIDEIETAEAIAANLLLAWQASDDQKDPTDELFDLPSLGSSTNHRRSNIIHYLEKASKLGLPDIYRFPYWLLVVDGLEWLQGFMKMRKGDIPDNLTSRREKMMYLYKQYPNHLAPIWQELNIKKESTIAQEQKDKTNTKKNILQRIVSMPQTMEEIDTIIRGKKAQTQIPKLLMHLGLTFLSHKFTQNLFETEESTQDESLMQRVKTATLQSLYQIQGSKAINNISEIFGNKTDPTIQRLEAPISNTHMALTQLLNLHPKLRHLHPYTTAEMFRSIYQIPIIGAFLKRSHEAVEQLYIEKDPAIVNKAFWINLAKTYT